MCVARHVHITQNNKSAISLQHLKKEVSDAVDFLHAGKHESLLQTDTIILMEMVKYFQSFQIASLQYPYNISRKKLGMEFIFCMQINIKTSTS